MNKKGFTLIELLAVVTIMAIIALIATPNIISLLDRSKKSDFITDAKEFSSKANYMFTRKEQKGYTFETEGDTNFKIKLKDIENIESLDSPFGGTYDENSYVYFILESVGENTEVSKYVPYIELKACKTLTSGNKECYSTGANNIQQKIQTSKLELKNVIGPVNE